MKTSRYLIIIMVIVSTVIMNGCDKKDCNGDFDGMWQLLLWTSPQGDTIATKDSMIFYSVQLQMMNFKKFTEPEVDINSSFEKYDGAIRVYNPIIYNGNGHDSIYNDTLILDQDTIIMVSILNKVGVPSDGVMTIESLSADELVLSSAQEGKLRFRKY